MLTHHISRLLATLFSRLLATLLVLLAYSSAQANEHHEEDHHKEELHGESQDHGSEQALEAHAHGTAELFIVLQGNELEIEMHSPAANLLGFEHKPRNDEQRAQVENLKIKLESADELFEINSATCQISDQELDLGNLAAENGAHNDEHSNEEEGHEDEHNSEHAGQDDVEIHSDIEAQYRYTCSQTDSIRSLITTIPNEFPSVESLEVQWIVNGRQGSTVLGKNKREVTFQ